MMWIGLNFSKKKRFRRFSSWMIELLITTFLIILSKTVMMTRTWIFLGRFCFARHFTDVCENILIQHDGDDEDINDLEHRLHVSLIFYARMFLINVKPNVLYPEFEFNYEFD